MLTGEYAEVASAISVPAPDGVRLWLVRLDGGAREVRLAERCLSSPERAYAQRGVPAVRRRRTLMRAAVRTALGRHLGLAPDAVPLFSTATGRPWVDATADIDVSWSTSDEIGMVAVAEGCRVGVDVERVSAWDPLVLVEPWLCPAERAAISRLPVARRATAATRSWTQKEAVLKGIGSGLRGGPAGISTIVEAETAWIAGWEVSSPAVPAGYLAAVAIRRPDDGTVHDARTAASADVEPWTRGISPI